MSSEKPIVGAGESSPAPDGSAEDVMYVVGMAPRVDKLEAFLANKPPRHQYIVMRAYARGLEIELRELRQNQVLRS
jgi:hypothetical protein